VGQGGLGVHHCNQGKHTARKGREEAYSFVCKGETNKCSTLGENLRRRVLSRFGRGRKKKERGVEQEERVGLKTVICNKQMKSRMQGSVEKIVCLGGLGEEGL